jgi:hypothetical protein
VLPQAIASVRIRIVLAVAALVMIGDGLSVRALSSMDTYAYAGYAKLGLAHAYEPTGVPFAGSFAPIGHLWGRPIIA